jgi:hypothetical protein
MVDANFFPYSMWSLWRAILFITGFVNLTKSIDLVTTGDLSDVKTPHRFRKEIVLRRFVADHEVPDTHRPKDESEKPKAKSDNKKRARRERTHGIYVCSGFFLFVFLCIINCFMTQSAKCRMICLL